MRLAVWATAILCAFSLLLTIFINLVAIFVLPQPLAVLAPPAISDPNMPFPTPTAYPASIPMEVIPASDFQEAALESMRIISFVGLGLILIFGGVTVYYLTGQPLMPIRLFSQTVKHISVQSLDTRLEMDGPKDEIRELAASFNTMLDKLEKAFTQQSEFVANAAHELRTPLSTLRTNLEVVLADPTASVKEYKDMGYRLETALTRLETLVADLLLLASGEKEGVKKPIILGPLLEQIVDELTPLATERQVSLHLKGDGAIEVWGNPLLMSRAIYNLVNNGIHYNYAHGQVEICLAQQSDTVIIEVVDTGIGIPADEQSLIFDRFYRVDRSRTRNQGGTGLGLAIVAHIVELHHGYITVDSKLKAGSTFTITLPVGYRYQS